MSVATFGYGKSGALGHGSLESSAAPAEVVVAGGEPVVAVSLGGAHSVALTARGSVYCWGQADRTGLDSAARLGCHSFQALPTRPSALRGRRATAIGCGAIYSAAAVAPSDADAGQHELWIWGEPVGNPAAATDGAALPIGVSNPPQLPTRLAVLPRPVRAVGCGALHMVVLLGNGSCWSTGSSRRGALGLGAEVEEACVLTEMLSGERQAAGESVIVSISAGGGHSVLTDSNGAVWACGDNRYGQLGVGDKNDRGLLSAVSLVYVHSSAEPAQQPEAEDAAKMTATLPHIRSAHCGDYHTVLVATSGDVFTCGQGRCGQLGHAMSDARLNASEGGPAALVDELQPRRVAGLPGKVVAAAAGGGLRCAHTLVIVELAAADPDHDVLEPMAEPLEEHVSRSQPYHSQRLFGFGTGTSGQLGPHSVANSSAPASYSKPISAEIKDVLHTALGTPVEIPLEPLLNEGDRSSVSDLAVVGVAAGWLHSAVLFTHRRHPSGLQASIAATEGMFELLSNEEIERVLASAGPSELCNFAQTCRLFRELAGANVLWLPLFHGRFGVNPSKEIVEHLNQTCGSTASWKRKFAEVALLEHRRRAGFGSVPRTGKAAKSKQTDGGVFSKLAKRIGFGPSEGRFLLVGLDAAGKTTILYMLKLGTIVTTIPTIGFNVETINYANMEMTMWDVGGPDKIRPLWRHYYQNTQAIIFVVDSNDRERLSQAREELHRAIAEPDLADRPILLYAHKQDMPHAMNVSEISDGLQLSRLQGRPWYIQPSWVSGAEGSERTMNDASGLYEGLQWLTEQLI